MKIENTTSRWEPDSNSWWQWGTVEDRIIGRWVEADGTPCYDDQVWCIEQDAEAILNARDSGDRCWDDGRHTDEIVDFADEIKQAWGKVANPATAA